MSKGSLGERIVAAREKAGLTRTAFADALNVTYTAAWNWEEKGRQPKPPMLAKIAKLLGVSEGHLRGSPTANANAPSGADEILADCRRQLALELKVPAYRVKVTMELVSE